MSQKKNRTNIQGGGLITKNISKRSYKNKPLISVITVVYNDVKHIEETIESVINQTYDNLEYIVIDGGSTDGTVDIIRKYNQKIDYWISEPDRSLFDAMNKGIKLSKGGIVNMMNCGDFYYNKNIIKDITDIFIKDRNLSCVIGLCKFIKDNGDDYKINNKTLVTSLRAGIFNTLCHQAFFYKKVLHKKFGFYDFERYKFAADGFFMYKVYYSKKYKKYLYNKTLAMRRREGKCRCPESIKEHIRLYKEIFGRSPILWLLWVKYYLLRCPFGYKIYNIYEKIKHLYES